MVSEKNGFTILYFYRRGRCGRGWRGRRGRRGCRGRRPVHNTNLEKWLFSIIYCGKNIQSIFIKFSGFVYPVKDYCCAHFRNQQSF